MPPTLFALALLTLVADPQPAPTSSAVPADWPPRPDFRQAIDYVKWAQTQRASGATADARSLYDELFVLPSDPPESEEAKSKLWGEDKRGEIPGLFTGFEPTPADYAWDPKDHPTWEEAWKINHQLREKLIALSQKPCLAPRFELGVKPADASPDDFSVEPLLFNLPFTSLAPARRVVKVLLQNAWRAPDGHANAKSINEAVFACLRIARQLETPAPSTIQYFVDVAIRELAYDSVLRALDGGIFDDDDIQEIDQFLASEDRNVIDPLRSQAELLATRFDLLQYCYLPFGDNSGQPLPNRSRLAKITKAFSTWQEKSPEYHQRPLDLAGEIDRCSPSLAVQQLLHHELAIRDIYRKELPQDAEVKIDALCEAFASDPSNHVVLRQFVAGLYRGGACLLCTCAEANRRATRCVFALESERRSTGQWPLSLRAVRSLTPPWRIDPFSRKDFVYRVTGKTMTLYSVASNGKDDGGPDYPRWGEEWKDGKPKWRYADDVFWPRAKPRS